MDDRYVRDFVGYVGSQLCQVFLRPRLTPLKYYSDELPTSDGVWLQYIKDLLIESDDKWVAVFLRKFNSSISLLLNACRDHADEMRSHNGTILLFGDDRYPSILREIHDPPLAINVLGTVSLLEQYPVRMAVVGSRNAIPFSLNQAADIGKMLARKSVAVVSGGAYGCDIAAHHGVLSSCVHPAPAIVVFAGGLERFYPVGNQNVFDEILSQGGLMMSEKLYSHKARAFDFPIRNRIIAGLAQSTILIQSQMRSGAMLTANKALDFGRELYVLMPLLDGHDAYEGNMRLLLDGAVGFDSVVSFEEGDFSGFRSLPHAPREGMKEYAHG